MIFSIDPGKTTGAVLMKGLRHPDLRLHLESFGYSLQPLAEVLRRERHRLSKVVIERPPAQGHDTFLIGLYVRVVALAERMDLPVEEVLPATWKPAIKALQVAPPKVLSRHERDAWWMGYYVLWRDQRS